MKKILNTAIILLIVTSILILSSVCFATQTKQSIDLKPISDSRFAVGTGYLGGEIVIAEEIENSKIGMYWKAVAAQSANEDMTFKINITGENYNKEISGLKLGGLQILEIGNLKSGKYRYMILPEKENNTDSYLMGNKFYCQEIL